MFGTERRGAPVTAFVRVGDVKIKEKTQIYFPDCLIVTDPLLAKSTAIYSGLKPGSILVVNSSEPPGEIRHQNARVTGVVNATQIALEEIGRPITNSCMLGAFARTTGWLASHEWL